MHVQTTLKSMTVRFALEVLHPTSYETIMRYQQQDASLIKIAKEHKDNSIKHCHRADKKYSLIWGKNGIVIPKQLERRVAEWYHHMPCHPGEACTKLTIVQLYYWKNLRQTVHKVCFKCDSYQFLKWNKTSYRKLPAKKVESNPWDLLCVDLIGKYQFSSKASDLC